MTHEHSWSGLGQALRCGCVKSVNGIPILLLLIIRPPTAILMKTKDWKTCTDLLALKNTTCHDNVWQIQLYKKDCVTPCFTLYSKFPWHFTIILWCHHAYCQFLCDVTFTTCLNLLFYSQSLGRNRRKYVVFHWS